MPDPLDFKVISDNEQDRAECDHWWTTATIEEKVILWETIQKDFTGDPAMEVMSRFAQLAFADMVERHELATESTTE